ncbi:MAG TPA: glycosyltransferase [Terracidiphilus sp.]|nr:glycosyltransferase [Terracidiphilus sp.]
MRIVDIICTTDAESGGPIEAVRRISEVLAQDGHTVTVVSLETQEVASRRTYKGAVTAVGVGPGVAGRYRYNTELDRWMRQHADEFDVAIAHGVWNYSSIGMWRALRRHPLPYFIFMHGMLDPWFSEQYPLKHWLKQIYWLALEGRVLRDADAVLFTCEEERLRARNVFRGFSYREQVVMYGTAAPTGDPEQQKKAFVEAFPGLKGRQWLLFISRVHPKKGCDLLIEAFAQCLPELPADLDLAIAGPDQVGIIPELQALASRLGVAERVHWTGMLTGDLKWGALHGAEAMVLPSHQENFGFVVAEAMACSTPVLISDKVNIWREVLEYGGGMVESDTLEGTCRLIRRLLALSAEERAAMGKGGKVAFHRYFDIETTARDFALTIGKIAGIDISVPVAS